MSGPARLPDNYARSYHRARRVRERLARESLRDAILIEAAQSETLARLRSVMQKWPDLDIAEVIIAAMAAPQMAENRPGIEIHNATHR